MRSPFPRQSPFKRTLLAALRLRGASRRPTPDFPIVLCSSGHFGRVSSGKHLGSLSTPDGFKRRELLRGQRWHRIGTLLQTSCITCTTNLEIERRASVLQEQGDALSCGQRAVLPSSGPFQHWCGTQEVVGTDSGGSPLGKEKEATLAKGTHHHHNVAARSQLSVSLASTAIVDIVCRRRALRDSATP